MCLVRLVNMREVIVSETKLVRVTIRGKGGGKINHVVVWGDILSTLVFILSDIESYTIAIGYYFVRNFLGNALLVGQQTRVASMKNSMESPQKSKSRYIP